jgi:hypothetical protein
LYSLKHSSKPFVKHVFSKDGHVPCITLYFGVQVFAAIKNQISENLRTYSSPQTRAQPGKPWVRGWDDNRKVGGPQAGNQ